jgi:formate dehydrogenase maturation protein FdhE
MTGRTDFSDEDWAAVVAAPLLAAMTVVSAVPSSAARETMAVIRAYKAAREGSHGDLLTAVLDESPASKAAKQKSPREQVREKAEESLRAAVSALDRAASPDEMTEYKRFVLALAESAAHAQRRGGFLRRRREISEGEQSALDAIAAAVAYPARRP